MTSALDSCAAGFCVTFGASVNIERPRGQFIEAANFINSNPACVVSIKQYLDGQDCAVSTLEVLCCGTGTIAISSAVRRHCRHALWKRGKKIRRGCRISGSFSALPIEDTQRCH